MYIIAAERPLHLLAALIAVGAPPATLCKVASSRLLPPGASKLGPTRKEETFLLSPSHKLSGVTLFNASGDIMLVLGDRKRFTNPTDSYFSKTGRMLVLVTIICHQVAPVVPERVL